MNVFLYTEILNGKNNTIIANSISKSSDAIYESIENNCLS